SVICPRGAGMSRIKVRASFCVSNVGTIVSSSGEALGLGAGVGMSVCVCAIGDNAKSTSTIPRLPVAPQIGLIRMKSLRKSGQSPDKSMPLQKQVHFLRQFPANAFRSRDLINACPAKPIHGPKSL